MKNPLTYQSARDAAGRLPEGLVGIDDRLTVAEFFYLSLEIWKGCAASVGPNPDQSFKALICAGSEGDGQNYSRRLLDRAGRGMHRAARRLAYDLCDTDRDLLTTHLLNYVATMPNGLLRDCYSESPVEPLKFMGILES